MTVEYVCSVHPDVVLFTVTAKPERQLFGGFQLVIVDDLPRECPKCLKSYYRSECEERKP